MRGGIFGIQYVEFQRFDATAPLRPPAGKENMAAVKPAQHLFCRSRGIGSIDIVDDQEPTGVLAQPAQRRRQLHILLRFMLFRQIEHQRPRQRGQIPAQLLRSVGGDKQHGAVIVLMLLLLTGLRYAAGGRVCLAASDDHASLSPPTLRRSCAGICAAADGKAYETQEDVVWATLAASAPPEEILSPTMSMLPMPQPRHREYRHCRRSGTSRGARAASAASPPTSHPPAFHAFPADRAPTAPTARPDSGAALAKCRRGQTARRCNRPDAARHTRPPAASCRRRPARAMPCQQ